MNLRDALLCIDCEWLYSASTHCPRCGSQVAYPVARAMNDDRAAVGRFLVSRRARLKPRPREPVFVG